MRLIYADPGLMGTGGHHATACQNIITHAHACGFEIMVFANSRMAPYLASQLGAVPLFRTDPTRITDGDPFCGFINACFEDAASFSEDLESISELTGDDLVYMPSIQGAHLLGLSKWLARRSSSDTPSVVVNLNFQPGLEPSIEGGRRIWLTRDPRVDPRAAIYRHAGQHLAAISAPKLHLATEHAEWVSPYSELLLRQVRHLPTMPFEGPKTLTRRGGRQILTIASVGHQWENKGFHFIPEIFGRLLQRPERLRLVVHDSSQKTNIVPEAREALAAMAATNADVVFDTRILNRETYQALLDATDLLLCPYNPDHYRSTLSGVVTEAIANAIPVVLPGDTALAADAAAYHVGVPFDSFDAPSILAAIHRVLDDYDNYASAALAGAERWAQEKGAGRFVDEILRLSKKMQK